MRTRVFLETRLGITGFYIFDSHGAPVNGYDIEKYYVLAKNDPEFLERWKKKVRSLGYEY